MKQSDDSERDRRGLIRSLEEADVDQVVDLWYRASIVAHAFLPDDFFEREREEIVERWLAIADTVVYENAGRIAGFLSLVGDEVGAIFVAPEMQRRGIGRALMDHARARRAHLELAVFERNPTGRAFYERYGFEVAERRIDETTGEPELRLRLE